jgi:hypothetical protein
MQISKRALLILTEATATSVLGLIHTGAGVALTFGLAFVHIRIEREMPVQPPNGIVQQVSGQSATLPTLAQSKEKSVK